MGESRSSSDEKLLSEDHDTCHCIIAYNRSTGEALMFHVWEYNYDGLSEQQKIDAHRFMEISGDKIALRLVSDRSSVNPDPKRQAKEQLKAMGLTFLDDIPVGAQKVNWDVSFDPQTREAEVISRGGVMHSPRTLYRSQLFEPNHNLANTKSPLNFQSRF